MHTIEIELIKVIINDEIWYKKLDNINYDYMNDFGNFPIELVTLDSSSGRNPGLVLVEEHTSFCYDDNMESSYFYYREMKYSPLTGAKICYKIKSTINLSEKYNELFKALEYLGNKRRNKQEKLLYKLIRSDLHSMTNNFLPLKAYNPEENCYYD